MSQAAASILSHLMAVDAERQRRSQDPALAQKVSTLKAWQQARFAATHADLLRDARYGAAARFFLDDLYGPQDFAQRDAQFARIVPALVRLFPAEVVDTVDALAALHALSESLDTQMASLLANGPVTAEGYGEGWRRTGCREQRFAQLEMALGLGRRLEKLTRKPLLRHSLRLMRGPARAAGLEALQSFLERGFDAFATMGRADAFLAQIEARERQLMTQLFDGVSSVTTTP